MKFSSVEINKLIKLVSPAIFALSILSGGYTQAEIVDEGRFSKGDGIYCYSPREIDEVYRLNISPSGQGKAIIQQEVPMPGAGAWMIVHKPLQLDVTEGNFGEGYQLFFNSTGMPNQEGYVGSEPLVLILLDEPKGSTQSGPSLPVDYIRGRVGFLSFAGAERLQCFDKPPTTYTSFQVSPDEIVLANLKRDPFWPEAGDHGTPLVGL